MGLRAESDGERCDSPVPLESVLRTEQLQRRPSRPPDYQTENRALARLVSALADSPRTILQTLADTILEVCQADSAGLSLLSTQDGGARFYWPAIAGAWKPHVGSGTPREFGPCGDVLDCGAPLLFTHFERRYRYLQAATPAAEEALLIPFHVNGKAVGTIWAMAHDDRRRFDAEDLRRLESLGRFASAAYQAMQRDTAENSRRAALNLMEDAVQAREATEQVNAELRESEGRFRMLADNMAPLAWTCASLGNVTWYNQRWLDYTGLSFDAAKGWDWSKVLHPDHLERVVASVQQSATSGEPWEDTFPLRGKAGQYRWFLSRAVPIRGQAGDIVRWFGTNTDITEQREMADELRRSAAELTDADRRKNVFLATLAHELRNPLAPIRSALQILRLTRGNGTAAEAAADMMDRQVGQMVRLVDDLLDVSRISRGTIELRRTPVDLASVVQLTVEAAQPAYDSKHVELAVALPREPLPLDADATRLVQVLGNLLSNACKFTGLGGRVVLSAERDGSEVVIKVRDNGIGIAAEQLPHIFEMFMQVDTSIERAASGLGIGLTLVKDLIELHGGTVRASSEGAGRGSEFEVRLPLAAGVIASAAVPHSPRVGEPSKTPARRILVVDDNRDAAESLAELLQLSGHQTRLAYDGLEAVRAAAEFRPELVLLDIGLPQLNGFEAARRIRAEPWGQDMVLVALTGWGQDEDRRKSSEAGFDQHLVKPADHRELMSLLERLPAASR